MSLDRRASDRHRYQTSKSSLHLAQRKTYLYPLTDLNLLLIYVKLNQHPTWSFYLLPRFFRSRSPAHFQLNLTHTRHRAVAPIRPVFVRQNQHATRRAGFGSRGIARSIMSSILDAAMISRRRHRGCQERGMEVPKSLAKRGNRTSRTTFLCICYLLFKFYPTLSS